MSPRTRSAGLQKPNPGSSSRRSNVALKAEQDDTDDSSVDDDASILTGSIEVCSSSNFHVMQVPQSVTSPSDDLKESRTMLTT